MSDKTNREKLQEALDKFLELSSPLEDFNVIVDILKDASFNWLMIDYGMSAPPFDRINVKDFHMNAEEDSYTWTIFWDDGVEEKVKVTLDDFVCYMSEE